MKSAEAISEILKREGVEINNGYPVNHILEFAARADIRPVIADRNDWPTYGRRHLTHDQRQENRRFRWHRPGAENAFGGVAQAMANPFRSGHADGLCAQHRPH